MKAKSILVAFGIVLTLGFAGSARSRSLSLLPLLDHTASDRDQGGCGNCWVWARTAAMEIALYDQYGESRRFSIQYFNSCKSGRYACCGGGFPDFQDFYMGEGEERAVPWSNLNAHWQDGSRACANGCSLLSCGSISTWFYHQPIVSMSEELVPTHPPMSHAGAIEKIKVALHSNKGVVLGMNFPTARERALFHNFWRGSRGAEAIWTPTCGLDWDSSHGVGHTVLVVGYNDDDPAPANQYWIVLNSWGTFGGLRPDGVFRLAMHMDYGCTAVSSSGEDVYTYWWHVMDVEFQPTWAFPAHCAGIYPLLLLDR